MDRPVVCEVPVDVVEREGRHAKKAGALEILVVAAAEGIRAYNGVCPHLGGPLLEADIEAGRIRCPWHHYEFDAATGACLTAPGRLKRPATTATCAAAKAFALALSPLPFEVLDGKVRVFAK